MSDYADFASRKYGLWSILYRVENDHNGATRWMCKCDCGTEKVQWKGNLVRGLTRSCGCAKGSSISVAKKGIAVTHGMTKTPVWHTWQSMLGRCLNPNAKSFPIYGARGIKVCEKWLTFEGFFEDMGDRPLGTTLDRIDTDGDYCKENCRWATKDVQERNKRTNVFLEAFGEKKIITDWVRDTRCNTKHTATVQRRMKRGLSIEQAMTFLRRTGDVRNNPAGNPECVYEAIVPVEKV